MSKKKKNYIPKSVRKKTMSSDYRHLLSTEEKEYLDQFDYEYHAGGIYQEDTLLESEDAKEEARKNHNALRRDAFEVTGNTDRLIYTENATKMFLEDAHDEWDWERVYYRDGFKSAVEEILNQTEKDLDNKLIDKKVTLLRFVDKMIKLKKINKYERNQKRKKGKKS